MQISTYLFAAIAAFAAQATAQATAQACLPNGNICVNCSIGPPLLLGFLLSPERGSLCSYYYSPRQNNDPKTASVSPASCTAPWPSRCAGRTRNALSSGPPSCGPFQDASTISLPFVTAIQAMFLRLSLPEPNKPATSAFSDLNNGGTSSVGLYAFQLAKFACLYVVATGSKQNHDLLISLGADAVVDYKDVA
ncbi:hypothetical protein ONZ43_g1453 [Nemania bipapillata]|uniref:Uncharacterized protein n=1 Tax=Nemania bipapillata TaxID=110536 RepID=A0ACC2J4G2_9PEZI|nr:hypothetical protein ONZ43_g1453 [Nemania bipapillata]